MQPGRQIGHVLRTDQYDHNKGKTTFWRGLGGESKNGAEKGP